MRCWFSLSGCDFQSSPVAPRQESRTSNESRLCSLSKSPERSAILSRSDRATKNTQPLSVRRLAFVFLMAATEQPLAPPTSTATFARSCQTAAGKCHGPDEKNGKRDCGFDSRDGVLAKLESGKMAVVVWQTGPRAN